MACPSQGHHDLQSNDSQRFGQEAVDFALVGHRDHPVGKRGHLVHQKPSEHLVRSGMHNVAHLHVDATNLDHFNHSTGHVACNGIPRRRLDEFARLLVA